jgi:hypothetical protein
MRTHPASCRNESDLPSSRPSRRFGSRGGTGRNRGVVPALRYLPFGLHPDQASPDLPADARRRRLRSSRRIARARDPCSLTGPRQCASGEELTSAVIAHPGLSETSAPYQVREFMVCVEVAVAREWLRGGRGTAQPRHQTRRPVLGRVRSSQRAGRFNTGRVHPQRHPLGFLRYPPGEASRDVRSDAEHSLLPVGTCSSSSVQGARSGHGGRSVGSLLAEPWQGRRDRLVRLRPACARHTREVPRR